MSKVQDKVGREEKGWLDGRLPREHVGDAILGAIDGIITTFAVVAGAVGGEFSGTVVIVLGFASLLGDGLSMGVSNYLGSKSDQQLQETKREEELARIREQPDIEREKLRQIYQEKGLSGELLDEVVERIADERQRWMDEIMVAEEGKPPETSVIWSGVATTLFFVIIGSIPLIPFIFAGGGGEAAGGASGSGGSGLLASLSRGGPAFYTSMGLSAVTFFIVGALKGKVVGQRWWRAGLETLLTGGGAAIIAYLVGHFLRQGLGGAGSA